ncbi:alpha-1,2-fucosyltransferase [Urechidicola croceus]|uniref:Glycosyl transferase family 11 n=1 Tax=Urechidicola croceus TaxID=1850246 RepID=A0A1D8P8L0_9FLAO|nr:alpha-1,2-fucosyltransferase [Urechidicola croceus]AOW20916.1 hypothetical protein LPB138_09630 [Urechidicola croceus]
MIILKDKPGQLCNRLWAFSPFISEALENNTKIKILHFYDYYNYFEDLNTFKSVSFIKNKKALILYNLLFKILNKIPYKFLSHLGIIYDSQNYITEANQNNKLHLINGWSQKKPNKQLKLTDLQKLFRPKDIYANRVDNIFSKKRKVNDLIIGVHIRRGDYKDYRGGKYYYSDLTIINFILQIINEFDKNKKLTFLLCSNEKINIKAYNDVPVFQINNANLIEDLYGLSKCDYIIGPPSTFSMWASFYGQKPLYFLKESTSVIKKDNFSIISKQNHFKNGHIFSH